MSLCTWATVVSTVPSTSLHGVEPRQIFGESGEPVPLPTFLSFLELLEELNRDETESSGVKDTKLFCQESFSSSSSDIDLDKFLDLDGFNEEDVFEATSMEVQNLGTSDWTPQHSSFPSTSEYFCCPDYFLPSAEILPYEDVCKHEDFESTIKSGLFELFQDNTELKNAFKDPAETPLSTADCKSRHEFSGESPLNTAESKSAHEFSGESPSENETTCQCRREAPFHVAEKENTRKFPNETSLKASGRKEAAATSTHSGRAKTRVFTPLNGPQDPVKHKHNRKRKCTNCFERQESRPQCQSFAATCKQVKVGQGR